MPLAHILLPQIARKAEEIEAALGPRPAGYLAQPARPELVGAGTPQAEPAQPPKMRPGETASEAAMRELRGREPQRLDTIFRNAAERGFRRSAEREMGTRMLPPAAPPGGTPQLGEPIGTDELGRPIYEDTMRPMRGRVMRPEPGMPMGTDELGRPVDARGRAGGYLNQTAGAFRTADRVGIDVDPSGNPRMAGGRPTDVAATSKTGDFDQFATDVLETIYKPHIQAVEENDGKWPEGYFKDMSPAAKENIKAGYMEVLRRRKIAREGTPI